MKPSSVDQTRPRVAIIFDLDGTLVDSLPDIRTAINRLLHELGRPGLGAAEIRDGIGHGAARLVAHCIALSGAPMTDATIDHLTARYLALYESGLVLETEAYPGVAAMLRELRARGHRLAVCTNKPQKLAQGVLRALDLEQWFDAVVGGDQVERRKPHPDHVLATLSALSWDGSAALMVGDSENDVAAARGAGIPVAVVRFGYAKGAPQSLGADAVIESFADFSDVLDNISWRLENTGLS